jgi:hypothetical protein
MNNGTGFTQWQPTAQIAWVKQTSGNAVLCQLWMEGYGSPQGFQSTGNARWQEVPTIEAPSRPEAANESEQTSLIL